MYKQIPKCNILLICDLKGDLKIPIGWKIFTRVSIILIYCPPWVLVLNLGSTQLWDNFENSLPLIWWIDDEQWKHHKSKSLVSLILNTFYCVIMTATHSGVLKEERQGHGVVAARPSRPWLLAGSVHSAFFVQKHLLQGWKTASQSTHGRAEAGSCSKTHKHSHKHTNAKTYWINSPNVTLPFVLHSLPGVTGRSVSEFSSLCDLLVWSVHGWNCAACCDVCSEAVWAPFWASSFWPDENTMTDCLCGAWMNGCATGIFSFPEWQRFVSAPVSPSCSNFCSAYEKQKQTNIDRQNE